MQSADAVFRTACVDTVYGNGNLTAIRKAYDFAMSKCHRTIEDALQDALCLCVKENVDEADIRVIMEPRRWRDILQMARMELPVDTTEYPDAEIIGKIEDGTYLRQIIREVERHGAVG